MPGKVKVWEAMVLIMTYDFILLARRDAALMRQLREAVTCDTNNEICTDIHRLYFNRNKKSVIIKPYSETSDFHWRVVPKEVTYQAFLKMLADDWDNIKPDEIRDVPD